MQTVINRQGHCCQYALICETGHVYYGLSSKSTTNQMLLGNSQVFKAYFASGIVRDKFDTLCKISTIGSSKNLKDYKKYYEAVYVLSSEHVEFSCDNAIKK